MSRHCRLIGGGKCDSADVLHVAISPDGSAIAAVSADHGPALGPLRDDAAASAGELAWAIVAATTARIVDGRATTP